ncbi:MAG: aminotransferase class V-fold PLP-dependent enzyme, partial [Bacteroidota bacterium]
MISASLDIDALRGEFPVLHQDVNGKPLIYFDNAATSQKPNRVVEALSSYYHNDNANIHRGVHALAERATNEYEETRQLVQDFIHANEKEEVIFTKGTTEGINLVAQAYGRKFLEAGDEILISAMEHHSNIVPWQLLAKQTGAILKVIPISDAGELVMDELDTLLSEKTKIVSVVYISNSLGTINPVKEIIDRAHAVGAKVMLDGAQAAPHERIDVQAL